MPKTTSKSFKKKKYNARFPPARIKKIMQTDEDVGKVAAAVPVIISRALEMFIESLIADASKLTQAKNAKTLSTSHIKQAITSTNQYDFLRDLVKNVPDHQTEDCNGDTASNGESSLSVKRGRGRPRNIDNVSYQKKRTDGNRSSSEDDEDEEEDVTDDTETDEEASSSNQVHNPLQPSFSDNNMSHNNNNNYVLTAAENASCSMPILRDSLISGKNIPQVLLPHDQSVSGDCPIALQQPPYQMPTSFNMPSNLAPHLHPNYNYSYPNNSSHLHPSSTLSPIILPSVLPQPVNLTNSLQQEQGAKKDDDYDT